MLGFNFEERLPRLLMWTFPIFWLGLGKQFPFALLGPSGVLIGQWFWSLLTLSWFIVLFSDRIPLPKDPPIHLWIRISLGLNLVFDVLQFRHFKSAGYPFPTWLLLWDALIFIGILFLSRKKHEKAFTHLVLLAIGCWGHRFISVLEFPLTEARSDMWLSIREGLTRLSHGVSPYSPSELGLGRMLYLPGTWISAWPSYALDVDMRWSGLLWLGFLLIALIFFLTRHRKADFDHLGLIMLWLANPYLGFRHDLYLDFFWLLIGLASLRSWRSSRVLSSFLIAIIALTLQWGLIIFPYLCLSLTEPKNPKRLFALSLTATVLTAFGAMTCYHLWGSQFFEAAFTLLKELRGDLCFGFVPIFYGHGDWASRLRSLQFIAMATIGFASLRQWQRGHEQKLIPGFALLVFCTLNGFLESYFYLTPLLMIAVAHATVPSKPEQISS